MYGDQFGEFVHVYWGLKQRQRQDEMSRNDIKMQGFQWALTADEIRWLLFSTKKKQLVWIKKMYHKIWMKKNHDGLS